MGAASLTVATATHIDVPAVASLTGPQEVKILKAIQKKGSIISNIKPFS